MTVGANAVATMDITDHAIVGGVPAKILKFKSNDQENITFREGHKLSSFLSL